MTRQRLTETTNSSGGRMQPGDTRAINVHDKDGNLQHVLTLTRTDREYVHDLCDAYNAAVTPGLEWCVSSAGQLYLRTTDVAVTARMLADGRKAEEDQRHWSANHKLAHRPFAGTPD